MHLRYGTVLPAEVGILKSLAVLAYLAAMFNLAELADLA